MSKVGCHSVFFNKRRMLEGSPTNTSGNRLNGVGNMYGAEYVDTTCVNSLRDSSPTLEEKRSQGCDASGEAAVKIEMTREIPIMRRTMKKNVKKAEEVPGLVSVVKYALESSVRKNVSAKERDKR